MGSQALHNGWVARVTTTSTRAPSDHQRGPSGERTEGFFLQRTEQTMWRESINLVEVRRERERYSWWHKAMCRKIFQVALVDLLMMKIHNGTIRRILAKNYTDRVRAQRCVLSRGQTLPSDAGEGAVGEWKRGTGGRNRRCQNLFSVVVEPEATVPTDIPVWAGRGTTKRQNKGMNDWIKKES